MKSSILTAILMLYLCPLVAAPLTFSSPMQQTTLVELYTSEGCYSCPPADKWLSTLRSDQRLWEQVIPVAFHVDYWNYLGWRDRFSKAEYSQRQRKYAAHRYTKTVYTPGLFRNGREWRAWFRNRNLGKVLNRDIGVLQATLNDLELEASFKPVTNVSQTLLLNVAVLGFDITTKVASGENEGKTLRHDFVALALSQHKTQEQNNVYQWQRIDIAELDLRLPNAKGIAIWVSFENDPTPLQATGGWLR